MSKFFVEIVLVLGLVVAGSAHAEMVEITHMNQILDSIHQDTLVVFDLDNTVMQPAQTLGTDQWFHYLVNKGESFGVDQNTAITKAAMLFSQVQEVTSVVPVESVTPYIIRAMQNQGVHAMALTARPAFLAATTVKQLKSIGVDFSLRPPYPQPLNLDGQDHEIYLNGVALISPFGDKGTALVTFLKMTGITPGNIVFVDDTLKNVVSVEKALDQTSFAHTSFRYGYDDAEVAQFDGAVADREWDVFSSTGQLISDDEAKSEAP